MHLLLLLMALLMKVGQAWILPASSPLRAAPRSNAPAVTVAGSLGEGDAGMDSSVVRARLSKPIGLMLAEKEVGKPGLRVDDMVEGGSAEFRQSLCVWCVDHHYFAQPPGEELRPGVALEKKKSPRGIRRRVAGHDSGRGLWCRLRRIDVRPSCGDAPEHAAGGTDRFRFLDRGGGARGNMKGGEEGCFE
ncbi:unnamed protein product [Ectocarpus sp. 13 AM-2016]